MARRFLWASLALAPLTLLLDVALHPDKVVLFALSAIALIPLAWLIGESTEHAAEYTGPRIGGLLNASFGNAPEMIISLIAIADGLPEVVRGSLAGSVVGNVLLVLGFALWLGPNDSELDRRSLWVQLGLVIAAVLVLLIPSVPGWSGNANRHSLAYVSIAPAIFLLLLYGFVTARGLRGEGAGHEPTDQAWSLKMSLIVLAIATVFTAAVCEVLVHSLEDFAHTAHLSEFFIAFVIVAVVGNAAEHGGAVVIARRGKMRLATEIAISSSAQVALLVIPVIALVSFAFDNPLTLAFRPWELGAMGVAAAGVAVVIRDGRAHRWEGRMLVGVYAALAVAFLFVGERGGG